MKEVISSNIAKIGYEDGMLIVEFKNGATWNYHDVPAETHEQMMKADSIGSFFARNIRGKFESGKRD